MAGFLSRSPFHGWFVNAGFISRDAGLEKPKTERQKLTTSRRGRIQPWYFSFYKMADSPPNRGFHWTQLTALHECCVSSSAPTAFPSIWQKYLLKGHLMITLQNDSRKHRSRLDQLQGLCSSAGLSNPPRQMLGAEAP